MPTYNFQVVTAPRTDRPTRQLGLIQARTWNEACVKAGAQFDENFKVHSGVKIVGGEDFTHLNRRHN